MKFTRILSIIAVGSAVALAPSLRAQDAAPTPATTGTGGNGGGRQFGRQGGGRGGETIERLTQELTLTTDEQTKIKPILDQLQTDTQAARTAANGDRQAMRTKMTDLRDKANAQIRALLTPDQQTKFDAYLANMRNRQGGQGGGRRGGGGGGNGGGNGGGGNAGGGGQ